MKLFDEFKKFAFKGNVLDMAVGVIIGGAFGKIVTSVVNDLITPFISLITGNVNFDDLKWVLRPETLAEDGITVEAAEIAVKYGSFLQGLLDFLLIAISIFIMVKLINAGREKAEAKKKAAEAAKLAEEEAAKAAEPPKPTTEELLAEIRDLLANK
ncbi:MAG: large-conductance mechanosensitive channel protein MscL [Firmicutes bacterium]|nr:large-conductance mechanosensitive channel protein MscL [Bacillota bacterium]